MVCKMSEILSMHLKEAVRVKIKKFDGMKTPEYKTFSIDPEITSFAVLQNLLVRAFNIQREFTISYLTKDSKCRETYTPLLSDWDLDVAISEASSPCLRLKVDLNPFEEGLEDWDVITPIDIPPKAVEVSNKRRSTIAGTFLSHVGKTVNLVQRAFSLDDSNSKEESTTRHPVTLNEFRNLLDTDGCLVRPKELRLLVYQGGVEPSLRKEVWKHILNVYPEGLSGDKRISYLKFKREEYNELKLAWHDLMKQGNLTDEMTAIMTLVRKDVCRTDRTHKFFAGSDDNKNVCSLFNILTTYALNHPSVSYCQGMSDLLSPILVTMKDDAQAYLCFCALMRRMKVNFSHDGQSMKTKFNHLSKLLAYYDPEFYTYLLEHDVQELLFCYRWLMLELKREFVYEDALLVLEVLWSSLPPDPPEGELPLFERRFVSFVNEISGKYEHSELPCMGNNNGEELYIDENHFCYPSKPKYQLENSLKEYTDKYNCKNKESESTVKQSIENNNVLQECVNQSTVEDQQVIPTRFCNSCHVQQFQRIVYHASFPRNDIQICYCRSKHSNDMDNVDLYQSWTYGDKPEQFTYSSTGYFKKHSKFCNLNSLREGDNLNLNSWCLTDTINLKRIQQRNCFRKHQRNESDKTKTEIKGSLNSLLKGSEVNSQQRCRHTSSDSNISSNSNALSKSSWSRSTSEISKTSDQKSNNRSEGYYSGVSSKEISLSDIEASLEQNDVFDSGIMDSGKLCMEALQYEKQRKSLLPPPHLLGDGNPFLLFLCLTILMQQKHVIVKNGMGFTELAMYFDKMVRKNKARHVLNQARGMFSEYLKMGWAEQTSDEDDKS